MNRTIAHYRVIECLGKGGMGEVYKAEDLKLRRTVALKFLPPEWLMDEEAKQRLLDEARAAAALNHSHIATIYELGQADGQSFIVMEYVEGETLAQKIERGPLEMGTALSIATQVAEALKAAHARGLIHCDIKSSNIMLAPDDDVKVLDFGLARLTPRPTKGGGVGDTYRSTGQPESFSGSTDSGVIMGTASYLSPEQVRGGLLDARTDLFSLGVVLYEMVTGRRPFEGNSLATLLQAILNEEPRALGAVCDDVPLELESIVRRALQKQRDERYPSAGETLSDLRQLRDQLKPQRHPGTETITTVAKESRRGSGALWLTRLLRFATLSRKTVSPVFSLPQGAAFRGLLPFQEADRDRFYGRETETLALFEMITHEEFRFGVLYGGSGCGKTSLVRAALLPKLWEEGYVPIYCRSYKDPLAAILRECRRRCQLEPFKTTDCTDYHRSEKDLKSVQFCAICGSDYLRRVADELSATLVIICDQFEEFFVNFPTRKDRDPFISFVAASHHAAGLPVKFLFSMRSDFLYLISSEFDGRIPDPLMSSRLYHLRAFDEEQAEEIIDRSVRQANLPFEAGLSRHVARDLATGGTVLPSELQIVGAQLQSKRIFTLRAYRRAGGKEHLVHSFLEDVIQASGDQEAARLLLRSLISEENTRLTLPLEEIARRTQRSRQTVERILNLFVGSRLIREIQDEEPWRYELMHEYLIEKINLVTGKVMDATQRANRLFRQHLSNYLVDKRARIPIGKLWEIRRFSDVERGERERALLQKSLRWGLEKWSALVVALAVVTTLAAAALSVSEEWENVRLSDGHAAAVRRAVVSPDGRLLVSVGEDATVIVWDFARRERLATFTDHTDWVNSVAFSPDGKWFATGSRDRTVIVWDAARLESTAVLRGHQVAVTTVAFSPDGRLLVSSGEAKRTILWSVGRWEKVRELPVGVGYGPLLFSPNGRQLMILDGQTLDLITGQQGAGFPGRRLGENWAALSPDATQMVTLDFDGTVNFWDLPRRTLLGRHRVHRDIGRTVAFSPDGRLVASGGEDIVLWDAATQTKLLRLEHTAIVWSLDFSPDGRWLVSSHGDGAILLWDVAERERVANFNEHSSPVRAVAFSPDGKRLASASEDRSVIIWDAERRRKEAVLIGHSTRVTGVAFSPDEKWVASCDLDGTVILWDVARHEPRLTFKHPGEGPAPSDCLAISPDGRWVATTHGVYESTEGRQVINLFGGNHRAGRVYGVAFSADGRWLACVTDDGQVLLWDAEKWQLLNRLESNDMTLISVSFSPDGQWLVTGEDEGAVRLWQVEPLHEVAVLGRHAARIKSVAFSPDGREVASAGDDQTIALWDVGRRGLITRIGTHTAPVLSVAFSPDGRRLASGEHDKSVRLYIRHHTLWGRRLDRLD